MHKCCWSLCNCFSCVGGKTLTCVCISCFYFRFGTREKGLSGDWLWRSFNSCASRNRAVSEHSAEDSSSSSRQKRVDSHLVWDKVCMLCVCACIYIYINIYNWYELLEKEKLCQIVWRDTHFEDFTFIWMCKFVIFKLMQPLGKVLNKFS